MPREEEKIFIMKSLLQGYHLAVYSSIKPGSIHRLVLGEEGEKLTANIIGALDRVSEAIEIGIKVKSGELAATHIGLGRLLARGLRDAYRWVHGTVFPDMIAPPVVYGFAIAHSEPDSIISDYGRVKRSLELAVTSRDWREIKAFLEALRSVRRNDMVEHLSSTGVSGFEGLRGETAFTDVFRILGSRWPGFRSIDVYDKSILDLVKKLLDYYRSTGDAENSIVRLYLDLTRSRMPDWARQKIDEAIGKGLMASKEGSKLLFEADVELKRKGYSFNEYVPLLGIITSLAVYDGLRP